MPRKPRLKSQTGIYHVILRGINKQDIFFDEEDYLTMMQTLVTVRQYKGYMGENRKDGCEIYAYCIMPNHMHLLIKELKTGIGKLMQKIEDSFVHYYNYKYERVGPLFQSRYRSEPVLDNKYLLQLMRFIHCDPVKAKLCNRPEDYEYSSWREYYDVDNARKFVCSTYKIMQITDYQELVHLVYEDVDDNCMDINDETPVINDEHAWEILSILSGCDTPAEFKQLPPTDQIEYIKRLYLRGVSIRQAARLSSVTYYMIRKSLKIRDGEEETLVSHNNDKASTWFQV